MSVRASLIRRSGSAAEDRLAKTFLRDVVQGLSASPKRLPCKYFYDARGSQLFDKICQLDEYYLTRTEARIMSHGAVEMGQQIGPGVMLVEYGSGSSLKTRQLLDALPQPVAYVPVDISRAHLHATARRLSNEYPQLEVLPVCADFTRDFALPSAVGAASHVAVYFPGSTIGNFEPLAAEQLLRRIAGQCQPGGGLLIGIDLQKDATVIEAAYNDRAGVTAEFNLNLLHRINQELGGDFRIDQFAHRAAYDPQHGRVDLSLVSQRDQAATVGRQRFHFRAGESIHTEYSHKYTVDGFARMARRAGLQLHRSWSDDQDFFAVLHLAAAAPA